MIDAGYLVELSQQGILKEIFEELEKDIMDLWSSSTHYDEAAREGFYQDLMATRRLQNKLQAIVDNNKFT